MSDSTFRGSCLCGAITYQISQPFIFFHHCHCSRCRKTSGSAHSAFIFIKAAQFAWTSGEDLVGRFELPSAEHYCSGFCTVCGSSMPWFSRNSKYVLVPAGTLDDDPEARPDSNIYWESRAPWFTEVSKLPMHPEGH